MRRWLVDVLVSSVLVLVALASLSVPLPAAGFDIEDPYWTKDEVKKHIYSGIDTAYHCFKLLSIDGQFGCESQPSSDDQHTCTRSVARSLQQSLSRLASIRCTAHLSLCCSSVGVLPSQRLSMGSAE